MNSYFNKAKFNAQHVISEMILPRQLSALVLATKTTTAKRTHPVTNKLFLNLKTARKHTQPKPKPKPTAPSLPVRTAHMSIRRYDLTQLWYITQHRTDLIIVLLILQTIITAQTLSVRDEQIQQSTYNQLTLSSPVVSNGYTSKC